MVSLMLIISFPRYLASSSQSKDRNSSIIKKLPEVACKMMFSADYRSAPFDNRCPDKILEQRRSQVMKFKP